ncbi:hypothetical protein QZH41_006180 [Actinostola sp. cb2023]|nr:hypothetical protein QZH41_006180 [Actinostola sp. cb2023]
MATEPTKLVICGGGNGAHAWSGIASSQPNTEVRVLTLFQDEAQRWSDSLHKGDFTVSLYRDEKVYAHLQSKPKLVTKKPEEAVPGCDVIAFVLPAFAHEQYLKAIKPYIEPGMILVGFPGQPGFEFQEREILGDLAKQLTLVNYESLPWATRLTEFGKSCDVLGTKDAMLGAVKVGSATPKKDPYTVVQKLIGEKPMLTTKGHLLAVNLMSVNGYIHSSILYERWINWDGKPLDERPLFYQGISQESASLLSAVSDEVLSIAKAITDQSPKTDLSRTIHVLDWYKRCYANDIEDKSTLFTAITTNKAYKGLTHPMVQAEGGKWVPNFNYRYLTEDVPYGLVVTRGIAEIMGVATPNMDKILTWVQGKLNKKYLVDGKIQGDDVKETRAPQRYGFTTLKDLIEYVDTKLPMATEPTKLVICGGGNGAHAWSGIASSQPNTEVRVLTLFQDEAQRWSDSLHKGDFTVSLYRDEKVYAQLQSKPKLVTKKPEEAIPGCDVIAFVLPAFAHEQYLKAIKPYIEPGMILVGLPGQSGFEFQVHGILGDVTKQCAIVSMESLPWATRITEFGKSCEVLGIKESLLGAIRTGSSSPKKDPQTLLQSLLGAKPVIDIKGDLLSITLMCDAFLHPCILRDRWANWDGTPLDKQPLFYHGISEQAAVDLSLMSDEVLTVVKAIAEQSPKTDLSRVGHILDWFKRSYANDIEDKSTLFTAITTNKAYKGLTHPMVQAEGGKWVPNFRHRYITEDMPFGLIVARGIIEVVGVKTPHIDGLIEWTQNKMGKKYLVDGKIQGDDVKETRMTSEPTKLVICGGGNGAHAWSGIASSQPNTEVRVLTLFQDEAQRWSDSLHKGDFTVSLYRDEKVYAQLQSKPKLVTKKPEEAVPGCDVIAFVLPAFAHEQYLKAIKPYIEPGMILVGLPGRSGFDFQVYGVLGDVAKKCSVMNFESLPWATRITEFGKSCEVLGTKESLLDVPYGLVVARGIAEIMGVATPNMDKILTWAQGKLNKKYLVDGKIQGDDVKETRAPQRYGFTTLKDLVKMATEPTKLVICGGGNGAHAWAGIASSQPNTEVRVLTLFQDEAQRWSDSLHKGDFTVSLYRDEKVYAQLQSKPKLVTKKPEEAVPGCDVIAFVLPAFAHEQYLQAIKPYIEPGMILVGLPGQPGFDFQVYSVLGAAGKQCSVMNFETLPWATRIIEFGKSCEVLGTKESLLGAVGVGSVPPKKDPHTVLQSLVGNKPVLDIKGDLIGVTLMGGGFLHPCLLHDRWANWDGEPLDEKPLFYQGISQEGASMLSALSDEKLAIIKAITDQSPKTDLSRIQHTFDWYKRCYANDIEDKSTLFTAITTNKAYKGLTHPMIQAEGGKWVPNFNYRYLTEDVPCGLVVTRGTAEIVGVATPNMDKILTWAQGKLNKKYLVDGKIQGDDVKETRAPQRYGFTTLKDLILSYVARASTKVIPSLRMANEPTKLVICGGGNGAHAWAGIASSQPNTEVRVLTLFQDEAQRWSDSLHKGDFTVSLYRDEKVYAQLQSKPKLVTKKPEEAVPGCDVIAFVLPAFAQEQYLQAIKPYIEPGMILVGFPGQPGFKFQEREILGDLAKQLTLVNYESLPWATRLTEFGKSCDVLGTKDAMLGAVKVGSATPKKDPYTVVQKLIDVPYGLVVTRGIAEIMDVATPNMDKILTWAQGKLNKKYLVDGKIQGDDVKETRAPQRYGFTTLKDLVKMATEPTKLVICGGGNGAHAWAGIASSQPNTEVRVLTLFQDEAQRWSDSLHKGDFTVSLYRDEKVYAHLQSKPKLVTKKPEEAVPGCDVIAFVLPAFAHEQYLKAIKPYIEPGMILVGFPGQAGFEFQEREILGDLAKQVTLVNYESLPWVTRLTEFGKSCDVLGTKDAMLGAVKVGSATPKKDPYTVVQKLIGEKPMLTTKGHLLAVNLMSVNGYLHTSILYERWINWDGKPLDERPLFYQGLGEVAAKLLSNISDEVRDIANAISMQRPEFDMSEVIHLHPYYCKRYKYDVSDKTSLYTAIRTNAAFRGLLHPMVETADGKSLPNFKNRYFTEDVPYGLVVTRGIAEIMGVATPNMDKILTWAQGKLNKKYLVDGKIQGDDVKETRAPQRYGFTTLKDLSDDWERD